MDQFKMCLVVLRLNRILNIFEFKVASTVLTYAVIVYIIDPILPMFSSSPAVAAAIFSLIILSR